jgi:peptidoglycan/LPS O-acetylase OafA/YrhL
MFFIGWPTTRVGTTMAKRWIVPITRRVNHLPAARHIGYLDGLRALAVSLVVVRHVVLFAPAIATGVWIHVMQEGAHGVDLFFVISGFCLSYPTLAALNEQNPVRFNVAEFFAKRVTRIVPPYWIALGITVLIGAILIGSGVDISATSISMPSIAQALSQLVFFDHTDLTNPSFWTLAVEFRWYLLFPIALWLWVAHRRAFWAVIATCVVAYQFTLAGGVDVGTLPCFMLGIAAAAAQVRPGSLNKYAAYLFPFALAGAVALEPLRGAAWLGQDQFGFQVAAFLFVLAVGNYRGTRAVLAWMPLRAIGVASYSIYLMHQPILGILIGRYGWAPAPAVLVMVASCFAFWALFERTVLLARVRKPLVGYLSGPIANILRFAGAPAELQLSSAETHVERAADDVPQIHASPASAAPEIVHLPAG